MQIQWRCCNQSECEWSYCWN